jgi:hypothetical protein
MKTMGDNEIVQG